MLSHNRRSKRAIARPSSGAGLQRACSRHLLLFKGGRMLMSADDRRIQQPMASMASIRGLFDCCSRRIRGNCILDRARNSRNRPRLSPSVYVRSQTDQFASATMPLSESRGRLGSYSSGVVKSVALESDPLESDPSGDGLAVGSGSPVSFGPQPAKPLDRATAASTMIRTRLMIFSYVVLGRIAKRWL
jgi:hypothetical protein